MRHVPRVAALWVPGFAAAAARRREPALATVPLVLGTPRGGVWRVAAVSAEAAAGGVRPGMPLAQAESLCPTLERRPFDPIYLAGEFERVLAALEAHVAVEPVALGAAVFRPPPVLFGHSPRAALGLLLDKLAAAQGYLAAAGVAEGRGAAGIAARRAAAGSVEWVPPGGVATYLAPLPAALLPVSETMRQRLELLGLRTIGALAALSLGAVQAQFGPEGRLAWEIAHGCDARPLAPRDPPLVPAAEVLLDEPCADSTRLLAAVDRLLARALRELPPGQVVGRLRLLLTLEDQRTWERALVPRQPTADPAALRFPLETALRRERLPAAALDLRLELHALGSPAPLQLALLPDQRGRTDLALVSAVRSLRARFGANPLSRVAVLDPHHRLPERRYLLVEAS
jgi:nucleotidyltransferase/DNA polymerase involved in DNA repair